MRLIGTCPYCGKECDIHETNNPRWVYCDGCAREYPRELVLTEETTQDELCAIDADLKYYAE